jgi:F-type H+-transporting ATPase subunit delta
LTYQRSEAIIEPILKEYKHFANEARGVAEAEVISAFPLSEKDKEILVATFQKLIGKTIQINSKVDSDLLGGVVVRIGDRLYDGSLRTKLVRFQERLKQSRIG